MLPTDFTDLLSGINEFEDADDLLLGELTLAHTCPPVIAPFHGSLAYSLDTFSGIRSVPGSHD